jgi:oligoendopeptidase F
LNCSEKKIFLYRQHWLYCKQQYGVITGKMTITVDGQEYTLQQAGKFLESADRNKEKKCIQKFRKEEKSRY